MSTSLRQYIDANASLPPECVLGSLAWFTVQDGAYDGAKIEQAFTALNLNPAFLPPALNPADAFEKAAKEVEGKKYAVTLPTGGQATAEILVREAARTNHLIERHLIREVRDSSFRELDYSKVGEFVFYRPVADATGKVDHATARVRSTINPVIQGPERTLMEGMVAEFDQAYSRYSRFHDGQKMRGIFRRYLLFLNAIQMKPSVYFVHNSRATELEALQKFSEMFDGVDLSLWQLPDLPNMRTAVVDAFQREGEKEYSDVIKKIVDLKAKRGKLTLAAYTKLKEEYDDVTRKVGEYTRVLSVSQDRTSAASELALDALIDLQSAVLRTLQ